MSKIAKMYGTTVSKIAAKNGIKNVNLIYAGRKLKIDVEKTESSNNTREDMYTIKRGDTLTKISKKFNISINKIAKVNNIKNINLIYAGEKLKIYK